MDQQPASGPASGPSEPTIDPRSLLVFGEVGRAGSLTAAAQALGWTQPAVSQHVRRLERTLGVPLAVRRGRGIEITEAGRALLRHADAVAASLADAAREADAHAQARTGTVRLAAFPSASATIAAETVTVMAERHPGVELRLAQLEPPEARAALVAGECDVAVVFEHAGEDVARGDVDATWLLDDPVRLVVRRTDARAGQPELSLRDLADEAWVAGCPTCRRHLVGATARAGFVPDVRHSTDDYVVVQALVASGMAVATLPALALRASRHAGVFDVPVADLPPRRVLALTRRNTAQVPAVGHTLRALRTAAQRHAGD
ncbi:LysR family transcriptional regulator [Aeromicrobium massiliense]|uniref:LysR family transcriptional regulator n=1 Tax=Aeromicrobium massiliense TaxID=1464554 RepID=UPI0009DA97B6|nr:LysR family transcriptional regulator [Aeromicrobium massiliense]